MENQTRTIEMSLNVAAPVHEVYKMLTDAKGIEKWFATKAKSDPKPNGELVLFFVQHEERDGRYHDYRRCEFRAVEQNRLVQYSWPVGETLVTIELDGSVEGATTINLRHEGWSVLPDMHKSFEGHTNGWTFFMNNLKSFLEEGIDQRVNGLVRPMPSPDETSIRNEVELILQRLESEADQAANQ